MEVIDLGIDNLEPISLNISNDDTFQKSSSSLGPGIELLMNTDRKRTSSNTNFNIDDLNTLENELNDLSNVNTGDNSNGGNDFISSTTKKMSGIGNLFGFAGNTVNTPFNDTDSKIGKATASSLNENTKTFDGYGKINDIPQEFNSTVRMSEYEKRKKKRMMIKKLDEWYDKGLIKSSGHFNLDSNYNEVEDEYEACLEDKKCKDSIKLQQWWFMTFVNSIEYANTVFDPFGLNLDGWGEQVNEDIESYDEIFTELHNKYKGGKLSPELSLLLRLGFSAAVVNITNKALSTSTPGFNDIIKQSPELMKMFTNATVQSMNQQNSTSSFVNNILNNTGPPSINNSFGPPPPAIQTKGPPTTMQYTYNQPPSNRPDIAASRGTMFREKGVDINNNQENVTYQEKTIQPRQEMRGPQGDISDLLAGLKTKNTSQPSSTTNITNYEDDNESIISATSLRELQSNSIPKSSGRRKQRSDKNIISLDI